MAVKKTALYSSLWASCDELRGGMDASQYKDYVLTLLFMKYVSDKYAGDPHAMIVVPEGGSFEDMMALKGNKEIGDRINKIIGVLAEENDLKGFIDVADFNDEDRLGRGKEMVDRLSNPYWKEGDGSLKRFDFAVANPPFSYKSWSNEVNITEDEFERIQYGAPPDKNGDYAFFIHILKSLKSTGKAAVILLHGVLFCGNAEARIRQNLIRQDYIKGIICLPANLFYGTGIPACIIVLDKKIAALSGKVAAHLKKIGLEWA